MNRMLITGSTGNVGKEVIEKLLLLNDDTEIIAAVRNKSKAEKEFGKERIIFRNFDFEDPSSFETAFAGIDKLFLLRPPHITNIEKVFEPMIYQMKKSGIKEIVFLSVQGVEKVKFIPHYKIEKLIALSGMDYVFLRPSYFMQNLTSNLLSDIRAKNKIILPAGNAKFNWIDVKNIAEVTAVIFRNFNEYKNKAFEITGSENLSFYEAADMISKATGMEIRYRDVNPLRYYLIKKREGVSPGKIIVMIALHFLPRFQKAPKISKTYKEITGKDPTLLMDFIHREKSLLSGRNN